MNSVLERVNLICKNVLTYNQEPISFKKLLNLIRKSFRDNNFLIDIKTFKKNYLNKDQFYIEAYYYAEEDFQNKKFIEIKIFHKFDKESKFYQCQITDFLIQIFDSTVHELKHHQQSKKRNYQVYREHVEDIYELYLADPDEVDAYAFSIAIELLRSMSKYRAIKYMSRLSVLAKMKKDSKYISPSLSSYVEYFKGHAILKKIAKKVYKHLLNIDNNLIFK